MLDYQIIIDAVEEVGGIYVVTADHGNAEDMCKRDKHGKPLFDKNGNIQILTSHTLNPVSSSVPSSGHVMLFSLPLPWLKKIGRINLGYAVFIMLIDKFIILN